MSCLHKTVRAREDLLDIWLDIAANDPAAADRMLDAIEARLDILTRFPHAGPARPDIAPEARMLLEAPYLILYRVDDEVVQIVRVVHAARRLDMPTFLEGVE